MLDHALLSIGASVIVTVIANSFRSFGKLRIYRKIVYKKNSSGISLQIVGENGQVKLCAPVWLEFVNTKRKPLILRDISLVLFKGDKEAGKMVQISHSTFSNPKKPLETKEYGNEGKYTLVIPGESVINVDMLYWLRFNNVDFDRILFSYYNSRGKRILKDLVDFPGGWESKHKLKDEFWQEIK